MTSELRTYKPNWFTYILGKTIYKLIGWRVEGNMPPDLRKAVVIVAPHTSNWDFPVGLFASFCLNLSGYWVGKHTLFRWPIGLLMRRLGGVPIDRSASKNFVKQIAEYFRKYEDFRLIIAPEGTRKKAERWKTGFYYIAREASVPIVCAFIDFKRKVTGIGPIITPTGDIQKDFEIIRAFYENIGGKIPENISPVRI